MSSDYFRRKETKPAQEFHPSSLLIYTEGNRTRFVDFSDGDIKKLVAYTHPQSRQHFFFLRAIFENLQEDYEIVKTPFWLVVCQLIMSLAMRLSSKFNILHRFSVKYSFFGQITSHGHYQPTYQLPKGVCLLNIALFLRVNGI